MECKFVRVRFRNRGTFRLIDKYCTLILSWGFFPTLGPKAESRLVQRKQCRDFSKVRVKMSQLSSGGGGGADVNKKVSVVK